MPHGQTQALTLSHATTGPELRLDLRLGAVTMRKALFRAAVLSSTIWPGDSLQQWGVRICSQPMTVGV